MIVLYAAIIWKMCRNNTAAKMRSFQSKIFSRIRKQTNVNISQIVNNVCHRR